MRGDLYVSINLGIKYNARILLESNKLFFIIVLAIFSPALLLIHFPVSLSLLDDSEHKDGARLIVILYHVVSPIVISNFLLNYREIQWLLQVYSFPKIFILSIIASLKNNIVFLALWISSLLMFFFSKENLSPIKYVVFLFFNVLLYSIVFYLSFIAILRTVLREEMVGTMDRY